VDFIPVYFSTADLSVGEPDQRDALELPPAISAEPGLEDLPLADGEIGGYRLDVRGIAEELETRLRGYNVTTATFACNRGPSLPLCVPCGS
jgi:hypothetical protein